MLTQAFLQGLGPRLLNKSSGVHILRTYFRWMIDVENLKDLSLLNGMYLHFGVSCCVYFGLPDYA